MKRVFSFLMICLLCAMLAAPCFAEEFENPPVIDLAEYLSESQFEMLSEKLEGIRQQYHFEVAIVTEYEMSGYSAMSTADDIFDYCGYGAGPDDDGILLYICAEEREYWITTHADGLRVFNDNGIEYLKKHIVPYLKDNDYYGAMDTFADLADELLAKAASGKPFNQKQRDLGELLLIIGAALLLPLLIAYIMMKIKLSKMKTAVKNDYAADYIKPGSQKLTDKRDTFLYSHVTKTERPTSSGSSGSHSSSSGRTHGGGGGSF